LTSCNLRRQRGGAAAPPRTPPRPALRAGRYACACVVVVSFVAFGVLGRASRGLRSPPAAPRAASRRATHSAFGVLASLRSPPAGYARPLTAGRASLARPRPGVAAGPVALGVLGSCGRLGPARRATRRCSRRVLSRLARRSSAPRQGRAVSSSRERAAGGSGPGRALGRSGRVARAGSAPPSARPRAPAAGGAARPPTGVAPPGGPGRSPLGLTGLGARRRRARVPRPSPGRTDSRPHRPRATAAPIARWKPTRTEPASEHVPARERNVAGYGLAELRLAGGGSCFVVGLSRNARPGRLGPPVNRPVPSTVDRARSDARAAPPCGPS